MKYASRITLAALSVVQLTVSGCAAGGSGLSELLDKLFGGADPVDVLASLTDAGSTAFGAAGAGEEGGGGGGGSEGGNLDLGGGLDGGGLGGSIGEIATVHHPEPGSMALFGGGLAGTALLARRRRKSSKSCKRSKS